ncbi:universal stress protein [Pontixanthobacter gangjinensis]|uniref:Universal stress protein n=1 Tax=Pontixanthobacter gangjinensis TaxID=1028742 RepID=A0A6I4SNR5_9SPHN|nr:universal stress protein [Pontixanthobacter gangjinensis]MXO57279.1 universal stress protein [Pontixanthobacter gangjinensis]
MRSILLHIYDDEGMEARLQVALDLVRNFDGHITCVQAVPFEFGVPSDVYFSMAMEMASAFRASADRLQEELESKLEDEDVRWDWIRSNGDAISEIARLAPLSEIVVLGARNPTGKPSLPSRLASETVVSVRPPVLLAPPSSSRLQLDAPAVIAWNGSAECGHALQASLPLLRRASEVEILTVREQRPKSNVERLSASDAAKFLSRHEIEPLITELSPEDDASIAATLIDAAQARKVGLVIMGAYGRSRLRERVLGGVTRDMLCDPALPLLLSH